MPTKAWACHPETPGVLRGLIIIALLAWLLAPVALAAAPGEKPVVIPFNFESKFDDGRYGQMIGDMLWAKLHREGGSIIPETMQDVRDWCESTRTLPTPDTPLERMKEIVVKEQAGDIAIWGKVERVAGNETDVYDVWINVADFAADPVRMIYTERARTQTVSEIPHVHVKEALDRLHGREAPAPAAPRPVPRATLGVRARSPQGRLREGGRVPRRDGTRSRAA